MEICQTYIYIDVVYITKNISPILVQIKMIKRMRYLCFQLYH